MIKYFKFALLVVLMSPAVQAAGMPPLIDTEWLAANLGRDDLSVLDIQDSRDYARFHVPGAVNAHYGKWRTGEKDPAGPSMLPPVAPLEAMIGELGIGKQQL